jgi:hypothetical protein
VSRFRAPEPCTLVFGLLLARGVSLAEVLDDLRGTFASPTAVSHEFPFTQSGYYDREMGSGVRRAFGATGGLWEPERLPELKLSAHLLEDRWRDGERRRVNLDPALLNLAQVVLASAKPAGHRVYLGRGIYGEIEYVFEGKSFRPLPWTYPDYREPAAVEFFNRIRRAHKAARRLAPAQAALPGAARGAPVQGAEAGRLEGEQPTTDNRPLTTDNGQTT